MTAAAALISVLGYIMLIVDDILVGQMINHQAVGAIALVSPYKDIISFISIFVSGGSVSCILSEIGQLHKHRASTYFTVGLIAAAIVGVLLVIIGLPLKGILLNYVGRGSATYDYALSYYNCYLLVAFMYPVFIYLQQIVYIDGYERLYVISYCVEILCNILFSKLLTPKYGIAGIALGSAVGIIAGLAVLSFHFMKDKSSLKLNSHISGRKLLNMSKNGFTSASPFLFGAILSLLLNRFFVSHYSNVSLPILTVTNIVLKLEIVFSGICAAAAPFIALYYCEDNIPQLRRVLRFFRITILTVAVVFSALIIIFAPQIVKLFGINYHALALKAQTAVRIIPLGFIASSLSVLVFTFHSTSGSLRYACILSLLSEVGMTGLLVFPLAVFGGIRAMWIGFALSPYLVMLIMSMNVNAHGFNFRQMYSLRFPENDGVYSFALEVDPESISKLQNDLAALLDARGIGSGVANQLLLVVEEVYMLVYERNPGKTVLAECTLNLGDDILLVLKDNGVPFDVTDPNNKLSSFREYMVSRLMDNLTDRTRLTTLCCNRNAFRLPIK